MRGIDVARVVVLFTDQNGPAEDEDFSHGGDQGHHGRFTLLQKMLVAPGQGVVPAARPQ